MNLGTLHSVSDQRQQLTQHPPLIPSTVQRFGVSGLAVSCTYWLWLFLQENAVGCVGSASSN